MTGLATAPELDVDLRPTRARPSAAVLLGCMLLGACSDGDPAATAGETGNTGDALETGDTSTDTNDTNDTNDTSDTGETGGNGEAGEPDLPAPDLCEPDAGGPYWLLEGETVDVPIVCLGVLDLGGASFGIDPLPLGATYNPLTATMSWTPGLDQGAVYNLTITVADTQETTSVKIGVADRWDDPQNIPVVDPLIYTEEYGLPVLHLQNSPNITSQFYTPASVIYRGHTYVMESKLRGAASLGYPKNSYTLKFTKEDKFNEPDYAGGFLNKRKVVLISTFDDNTYVRQRLSYELWDLLDPGHIQVQVYSGVVFVNGAYWGLYTISDHVDGYLMEDHGYFQDGNLFKARTHDANFRLIANDGAPKGTLHQGLTKEEGLPLDGQPGAYDDLDALVSFVATASNASFDAQIDSLVDRRDYEDWWIFVSLIDARDSGGKNSYHYHDPNIDNPWRFVPWDFNHSFGQTWRTERVGTTSNPEEYTGRNEMFVRLLGSAQFGQPLRARYGARLQDLYDVDAVLVRYDDMIDETADSALRDEGKWRAQYLSYGLWNWRTDFTTYEEEVEYVRQWIIDRWAFVDGLY